MGVSGPIKALFDWFYVYMGEFYCKNVFRDGTYLSQNVGHEILWVFVSGRLGVCPDYKRDIGC